MYDSTLQRSGCWWLRIAGITGACTGRNRQFRRQQGNLPRHERLRKSMA